MKKFGHWFFSNVSFERTPNSSLANTSLIDCMPCMPQVKSSRQCGNVKRHPRIPFWVTYSPVRTTQFWSGSLQSWENVKRRFWTISPNLGAAKDPEHFPKWDVECAALSWVFWMKSDEYESWVGLLSTSYINIASLELRKSFDWKKTHPCSISHWVVQ